MIQAVRQETLRESEELPQKMRPRAWSPKAQPHACWHGAGSPQDHARRACPWSLRLSAKSSSENQEGPRKCGPRAWPWKFQTHACWHGAGSPEDHARGGTSLLIEAVRQEIFSESEGHPQIMPSPNMVPERPIPRLLARSWTYGGPCSGGHFAGD